MTALLAIILCCLLCLILWRAKRRAAGRRQAFADVLDAADALEAQLRTARARLQPGATDASDAIHAALQDMLRQRLWLQQHGAAASTHTLRQVHTAIVQAGREVDAPLRQLANTPGQPG